MKIHCVTETLLGMTFTYCYFLHCREKESNKEDQEKSRGRNRRFDKAHVSLFIHHLLILESFNLILVEIRVYL
jgi:hypothetical protein